MNLPLYAVAMVALYLAIRYGVRLWLSLWDEKGDLTPDEATGITTRDVTNGRPWLLTFKEMHAR